jgi:exopolyphosphatase/guanosine-5'-triphosphate,3'-diphosphate pyrophosphatase
MADYFAVVDVGSNALRFQLAFVHEPDCYRILMQERKPIRLGRQVFQTGTLDAESVETGLEALRDFKACADRYQVRAFKAVGTSFLREARNGQSFIARAQETGVPLEVISGEEEARLMSLGIMSGLSSDLPQGLFLDIGGGSVEVAVANRLTVYCVFSLPLGAVRLTEKFITSDPPTEKELKNLQRFICEVLRPMTRRVGRENFSMAFGSGGTIKALAHTDARVSGEGMPRGLTVLPRSRLNGLLDSLKSQPVSQRSSLLSGDPERADIIIAGGLVLLEIMTHLGLEYLFASDRGLCDGLMVDLLRNHYWDHETF